MTIHYIPHHCMQSTDCFWFHIYCCNIFTNGRKTIIDILQQNFNFNCSLEDFVIADDNVLLLDEN